MAAAAANVAALRELDLDDGVFLCELDLDDGVVLCELDDGAAAAISESVKAIGELDKLAANLAT